MDQVVQFRALIKDIYKVIPVLLQVTGEALSCSRKYNISLDIDSISKIWCRFKQIDVINDLRTYRKVIKERCVVELSEYDTKFIASIMTDIITLCKLINEPLLVRTKDIENQVSNIRKTLQSIEYYVSLDFTERYRDSQFISTTIDTCNSILHILTGVELLPAPIEEDLCIELSSINYSNMFDLLYEPVDVLIDYPNKIHVEDSMYYVEYIPHYTTHTSIIVYGEPVEMPVISIRRYFDVNKPGHDTIITQIDNDYAKIYGLDVDELKKQLCVVKVNPEVETETVKLSVIDGSVNAGSVDYPISKDKLENCYTPNGKTYPLCKGQTGNELCADCNVYEYDDTEV